jgi:hypothetical protein
MITEWKVFGAFLQNEAMVVNHVEKAMNGPDWTRSLRHHVEQHEWL